MGEPTNVLQEHPTGAVTAVATAIIVIANHFGAGFDGTESALIVGGIAAAVSAFTPRFRRN